MKKEIGLGLFVVFAVGIFSVLLFFLGNFSLGKSYTFDVMFTDVSGLPRKAPVKMSGVKVGTVSDIQLYNGEAKVTVRINRGVKIPSDATINISATGVVGSKYLDIRRLKQRDRADIVAVKAGDVLRGVPPYDMNQVLDRVMRVFNTLSADGNIENSPIFKAIKNLEEITDKINKGLGRDERDFREIVKNIQETTRSLKNIGEDIDELVSNNKEKLNEDVDKLGYVMDNAREISDKLNVAADKMNLLLDNINEGDGTISTLITDKEMAQELKETVTSVKEASSEIKEFTKRVRTIEVSWDTDLRYNTDDSKMRTDFGLIIQPKPDKRYILAVDNISSDAGTEYDEGNQKYNTFTGLIEKDFAKGKFTLHAGAIRSTGGIGGKYNYNKKLGFNVDMYRFNRETEDGKNVMWMDTFVTYKLTDWANLEVGAEDVIENPGFTSGVNVQVKDDDIAYLFGLVGFASLK